MKKIVFSLATATLLFGYYAKDINNSQINNGSFMEVPANFDGSGNIEGGTKKTDGAEENNVMPDFKLDTTSNDNNKKVTKISSQSEESDETTNEDVSDGTTSSTTTNTVSTDDITIVSSDGSEVTTTSTDDSSSDTVDNTASTSVSTTSGTTTASSSNANNDNVSDDKNVNVTINIDVNKEDDTVTSTDETSSGTTLPTTTRTTSSTTTNTVSTDDITIVSSDGSEVTTTSTDDSSSDTVDNTASTSVSTTSGTTTAITGPYTSSECYVSPRPAYCDDSNYVSTTSTNTDSNSASLQIIGEVNSISIANAGALKITDIPSGATKLVMTYTVTKFGYDWKSKDSFNVTEGTNKYIDLPSDFEEADKIIMNVTFYDDNENKIKEDQATYYSDYSDYDFIGGRNHYNGPVLYYEYSKNYENDSATNIEDKRAIVDDLNESELEDNACGAILCIASDDFYSDSSDSNNTKECVEYKNNYFSIEGTNWEDTIFKRKEYLSKCSMSEGNATQAEKDTNDLINTIIPNVQNDCSSESLNKVLEVEKEVVNQNGVDKNVSKYRIITKLPNYCKALFDSNATSRIVPKYSIKEDASSDYLDDIDTQNRIIPENGGQCDGSYYYTIDEAVNQQCWQQGKICQPDELNKIIEKRTVTAGDTSYVKGIYKIKNTLPAQCGNDYMLEYKCNNVGGFFKIFDYKDINGRWVVSAHIAKEEKCWKIKDSYKY